MKRPLIAANWKMNGTEPEAAALVDALLRLLAGGPARAEVVLAPPFTALRSVGERIRGSGIALGAQNLHSASHGAFTGEISASMLVALDVRFVIVGHSERRRLFHETDEDVARKAGAAEAAGMTPILCIGEEEADRLGGHTLEVLERQLRAGVGRISKTARGGGLVIAYEPVWAIGTGRTASRGQIVEAHAAIRSVLARETDDSLAVATRILYGGSVTADGAAEILACDGVDGALVGGASLKAESFAAIVASTPE